MPQNMKENFYTFFWPGAISDRRSAIHAIVAGVIAGSLLTGVVGLAGLLYFVRGGASSQVADVLFVTTLVLAVVTIGIWKHILSAALLGVVFGLAFMSWLVRDGELAIATVLFVPFVGGFVTAARGVWALKRDRLRDGSFIKNTGSK
jgi:hypothetical protein